MQANFDKDHEVSSALILNSKDHIYLKKCYYQWLKLYRMFFKWFLKNQYQNNNSN